MSVALKYLQSMPTAPRLGAIISLILVLVAIFGPLFAPYDNNEIVGGVWELSSSKFWLGTDSLGRDLLSRMIFGTRTTLVIAAAATVLSFTLGAVLGVSAAVVGGWFDMTISRFVDIMMSIPTLIFALVVLSVLPSSMITIILVMGILDSTRVFRLSRAVASDVNAMDFVEVARLRGEGLSWIVFREILPSALPALIAELGMRFIFAVLLLSTLSYLGLGVQPPETDWGSIVGDNKDGIVFGVQAALIPATAISLLAISINLVADWILNLATSRSGGRHDD